MKQATKAKIQKFFRVTHGWTGVIVFPLVLLIGLTGLALNHRTLVEGWIGSVPFDESVLANYPALNITPPQSATIAQRYWPDEAVLAYWNNKPYHGLDVYTFKKDSGQIIIDKTTGHYYVKTAFTRRTFSPDGELLNRKIYWKSLFKWLHVRGWPTKALGTWLADITASAMVFFAISGLWLFFAPRIKRIKRVLGKLKPAAKSKP